MNLLTKQSVVIPAAEVKQILLQHVQRNFAVVIGQNPEILVSGPSGAVEVGNVTISAQISRNSDKELPTETFR